MQVYFQTCPGLFRIVPALPAFISHIRFIYLASHQTASSARQRTAQCKPDPKPNEQEQKNFHRKGAKTRRAQRQAKKQITIGLFFISFAKTLRPLCTNGNSLGGRLCGGCFGLMQSPWDNEHSESA
jgi:hypothetical protein